MKDSIIFFDATVGREARVTKTIADVRVRIGDGCRVGETRWDDLAMIGIGSTIPDGVTLKAGVTVYPRVDATHFSANTYKKGEIVK